MLRAQPNVFRLFTLAGIPVRVSIWYVVLLLYFAYRLGPTEAAIWCACITLSLLVHEFGHGLTARHWRHRFAENRDKALAMYDEQFCRMWEFYIATSELVFTGGGGFVVAQFQMSKAKHTLPQTRDYIGAWEAGRRGMVGWDG